MIIQIHHFWDFFLEHCTISAQCGLHMEIQSEILRISIGSWILIWAPILLVATKGFLLIGWFILLFSLGIFIMLREVVIQANSIKYIPSIFCFGHYHQYVPFWVTFSSVILMWKYLKSSTTSMKRFLGYLTIPLGIPLDNGWVWFDDLYGYCTELLTLSNLDRCVVNKRISEYFGSILVHYFVTNMLL